MAVTKSQIEDLIKTTIVDCPLPSVADMLCNTDEDNKLHMLVFIKTHYTKEQIEEGVAEFHTRLEFIQTVFGSKESG